MAVPADRAGSGVLDSDNAMDIDPHQFAQVVRGAVRQRSAGARQDDGGVGVSVGVGEADHRSMPAQAMPAVCLERVMAARRACSDGYGASEAASGVLAETFSTPTPTALSRTRKRFGLATKADMTAPLGSSATMEVDLQRPSGLDGEGDFSSVWSAAPTPAERMMQSVMAVEPAQPHAQFARGDAAAVRDAAGAGAEASDADQLTHIFRGMKFFFCGLSEQDVRARRTHWGGCHTDRAVVRRQSCYAWSLGQAARASCAAAGPQHTLLCRTHWTGRQRRRVPQPAPRRLSRPPGCPPCCRAGAARRRPGRPRVWAEATAPRWSRPSG